MLKFNFSLECKKLIICIIRWLYFDGFKIVDFPNLERYISPRKHIQFHIKKNHRIYEVFIHYYGREENQLFQIGISKHKFRPEFEMLTNNIIIQLTRMGYRILHKEAKGFKYPFHQVCIIVKKDRHLYKISIFDGKWESIFNEVFG